MCDTYDGHNQPIPTNSRHAAAAILAKVADHRPMFAFEQEYSMFCNGTHLGWPVGGYPAPQGPYYCSAGVKNAFGRDIAESHYHACLYAGNILFAMITSHYLNYLFFKSIFMNWMTNE